MSATDLIGELLADARERMTKSVESSRHEFGSVRTGRASPALLDRVQVDYYGAATPLRQLANISTPEDRLLSITPYDKSSIKAIEKAIMESDVGLTPSNDGNVIRLTIPELTEERRRELVKVLHRLAEDGRVGVRNIRRDVMHDLRELKNDGELGADDERRAEGCRGVGGEERVARSRREDHDPPVLEVAHGPAPDVGLGHLGDRDRRLHAGLGLRLLERVLKRQRVQHGGEHPHVVAGGPPTPGARAHSPSGRSRP